MGRSRVPTTNLVMIGGRVTWGPDLKELSGGNAVCKFGFAYNRKFRKKDGGQGEESFYLNVEIWGAPARWANEDLYKGCPILITGKLKESKWTKDGVESVRMELNADKIEKLEWPEDGDSPQGAPADEEVPY